MLFCNASISGICEHPLAVFEFFSWADIVALLAFAYFGHSQLFFLTVPDCSWSIPTVPRTIRIDHENTGKLRKIKKRLGLFLGNVQERSVSIKKNSWMPKVVNWKIPTNKILIKIPKRNFLSVWLKFTRSFYIELGSEIGNSYFTLHVIYYKK